MGIVTASPLPLVSLSCSMPTSPNCESRGPTISSMPCKAPLLDSRRRLLTVASQVFTHGTIIIDNSSWDISEATSEAELWAAIRLRIRTFYGFRDSYGIEDHKMYLVEREFEALKERAAGKRVGFRRVSCINATLPMSLISGFADDLCKTCKFPSNDEDKVVVGTLDLNQCIRLPDEITGMNPKGIGADFARAYLSNVCVAKEMQRNGLGYALIEKSKMVAEDWGISDLYVHVAADNEPAKRLYTKSGFVFESDEPAWQARFLDRPRRFLFWTGIPNTYDF